VSCRETKEGIFEDKKKRKKRGRDFMSLAEKKDSHSYRNWKEPGRMKKITMKTMGTGRRLLLASPCGLGNHQLRKRVESLQGNWRLNNSGDEEKGLGFRGAFGGRGVDCGDSFGRSEGRKREKTRTRLKQENSLPMLERIED